ncbi:hypothetical protein OIE69_44440 (plasmid) [Actinacidiphila glaucinigra]|uniref:hypothetical protein n=1 Tax=Actinacidiphila glaucinigra TaxID=235986 RepID=UPI002DD82C72|nr:hypothetical protein [Actinacidiphila glaucinigra]WSD65757.1 hypothetical protein OIE69_43410 [Actinacidiphila glaucinigra]WSD65955.1 hypothetical protein OIE69_44440 [Actinacidiphila glaucinigra]
MTTIDHDKATEAPELNAEHATNPGPAAAPTVARNAFEQAASGALEALRPGRYTLRVCEDPRDLCDRGRCGTQSTRASGTLAEIQALTTAFRHAWVADENGTPVAGYRPGQRVTSTTHGDSGTVITYVSGDDHHNSLTRIVWDNTGDREVYSNTLRPADNPTAAPTDTVALIRANDIPTLLPSYLLRLHVELTAHAATVHDTSRYWHLLSAITHVEDVQAQEVPVPADLDAVLTRVNAALAV